ncbi:transporter substrate-binding domain-containing protein [Roseibium sp. AS2]|uniref:substrate-binding periplasmic protein n=1 Tax=Roseibium sp. AS2 TaxID=3135781 RepID=UPI00316DBBE3
MRRIIAGWVMACLFAGNALASDVVTACGHDDYPPWNWRSGDKIVGVCAEITSTVFARLGLEVSLDYAGPWSRCQKYVESGRIDVNICAFVNDTRKGYSTFAGRPMGINEISIFVRKGEEFAFTTLRDLSGKRAIMLDGVSIGQGNDVFLEANTMLYRMENRLQAFRFLEAGRADFFVTGKQIGLLQRDLHHFEDRITVLPRPVVQGPLYISVSKKSPFSGYLDQIDDILAEPGYMQMVENLLGKYKQVYLDENRTP